MTWLISGENGALKFEGKGTNVQVVPPRLFRYATSDTQGAHDWYQAAKEEGVWEEVQVEERGFGGVGELYKAVVDGVEEVVGFEGAVVRHRMVEAVKRSAETGKKESYI